MKKLLLLMLCCNIVYGSKAQVNITIDKNGKITDIEKNKKKKDNTQACKNKSASSCITLAELPADNKQKLEDFIRKNYEALKNEANLHKNISTATQEIKKSPAAYELVFEPLQYTIASKAPVTNITVTSENKDKIHCTETSTTVKYNNTGTIAIVKYHNNQFNKDLLRYWTALQKIETDIFQLRDYIYNLQLAVINDRMSLNGDDTSAVDQKLNSIKAALGNLEEDGIEAMCKWMYNTSALSGTTYTMNALGLVNPEKLPAFIDTATIAANIRSLTSKLNSDAPYNYSAVVMEQKRNNLQLQLNKIMAYYKQASQYAEQKKKYAEFTVIGKYAAPSTFDHYRFHNAEDELKLTNSDEAKETIYLNKDKIAIYTYNIPPKGEVSYEMKSVGIIQVLQFSRLAGGTLKQFNNINNKFATNAYLDSHTPQSIVTTLKSYNDKLDELQQLQEEIAIYTACVPPAEKIEFADDIDKAYTSRLDKLEELQNDSSYKNTYTLGLKVDGKEVIKPKSFNFISYKRSRIQFAAGVHFFSGNAPMVVTEGTGFKTVSYNTPRYSAGVKGYLFPQTFADVNKKTWGRTFIRSVHMALLVDAAKPLENQYLGIGFDLLPGLGINAGPHFYRYTAYQLYNNAVVGEKKTLKVRDGIQVSLTMDGGLAKDIFTTFLKLF